MSRRSKVESQISNFKTVNLYRKEYLALAENVFQFKNLDTEFLDLSYVNKQLVNVGSIAFFMDEVLGLLALPFVNMGKLDLYGRPIDIEVIGKNGYTRFLKKGEYVIMYDNQSRQPLLYDILQYAERTALIQRTIDINIKQQRTSRFWKTKAENKKSIEDMIDGVETNDDCIVTYDNFDLDETTCNLVPAPYVADKLSEQKDKIWNEFLRLIGVANQSFQKRERNIKDEVFISQAGTIASRYNRFESRRIAVEQINKKWNLNIEVEYYDGLPTTILNYEGGDNNVSIESNISD